MDMVTPLAQSVSDFFFYRYVLHYLHDEIIEFGVGVMHNTMKWVGAASLALMTLWVFVQGYRIATGRSRESMMHLVTNSLRATVIVAAATSMSFVGYDLHRFFTETVKDEINLIVTGDKGGPEEQIDRNLGYMQLALTSIDALDVMQDQTLNDDKSRALWFTGLGTGGPALIGGALLLLYEVAMALFIGFGPLFILSLLFEQTRLMFGRWLYYGLGTLFSMSVLSAMVSIATKMVAKVAAAFWVTAAFGRFLDLGADGITSQAMQQGGLGVILTVLIVSAPPMAAAFFQGALGSFIPYAQMGGGNGALPPNASPQLTRAPAERLMRDMPAAPTVSAPDAESTFARSQRPLVFGNDVRESRIAGGRGLAQRTGPIE